MDARQEERLVAIDVADSRDDALVEERIADGALGASVERRPDAVGIRVTAERIRAEPREDRAPLLLGYELAHRRPDQVDRDRRRSEPEADTRTGAGGVPLESMELSRHPEVDVDDAIPFPEVEQVLPVRVGAHEPAPIEPPRFPREPALRRPRANETAAEVLRVLRREAVDGVAFGHRVPTITRRGNRAVPLGCSRGVLR